MSWYILNNKKVPFKKDFYRSYSDITEIGITESVKHVTVIHTKLRLIRFEKSVHISILNLNNNLIKRIHIPAGIVHINLLNNPLESIVIENHKTRIFLNSFKIIGSILGKGNCVIENK